jgi:uncharacterized phage-associated protein
MPSTLNIPAAVRKSTQALNYFARLSASGSPRAEINKMKALKLLFFADRFHLRKYGRTVSDCAYFAMARGPVASEAKSVAEESSRLPSPSRAYARRYVRRKDAYCYSSTAEVDAAVLSRTDMEALDFAWQTFGHYTEFELVEITHRYPEWRRHAAKLRQPGHRRVEMDYTDFFSDPVAGYNVCHELSARERKIALGLFTDQQAFDQRWS